MQYGESLPSSFQFTRLLRGATRVVALFVGVGRVSIHAPLARRDRRDTFVSLSVKTFQFTRLLRGATAFEATIASTEAFQFTRLLRGATPARRQLPHQRQFQFTRLLRGATAAGP